MTSVTCGFAGDGMALGDVESALGDVESYRVGNVGVGSTAGAGTFVQHWYKLMEDETLGILLSPAGASATMYIVAARVSVVDVEHDGGRCYCHCHYYDSGILLPASVLQ